MSAVASPQTGRALIERYVGVARRLAINLGDWPLRAAVLALVALVYAPTLNDPFAGDDYLVLGPVRALGPWELIGKALILQDNIPYWRPLVSPLYALEVHGFGLRPAAYHAVVLGLHLTNVLLVSILAQRLTGRRTVALFAAALFGINAAHTTTVAQISSTVELQSVVFYLLTVLCAVRVAGGVGRRNLTPGPSPAELERGASALALQPASRVAKRLHPRSDKASLSSEAGEGPGVRLRRPTPPAARLWYLASLLCFILALLTKESAASAAAVVAAAFLLLDPNPHARLRRAIARSAPFFLIVLPYAAFTWITDTDEPTGVARELYKPGLHAGQNLWWLASRLAAPFGQGHGPDVSLAGHVGAALVIAAGVYLVVRGSPLTRFLVAWTFIALTPLAFWRADMMLGRFTYQAAIPFSILIALGLGAAEMRLRFLRPGAAIVVGAALIGLLAGLTLAQNRGRTREALAYGTLADKLPSPAEVPAGSSIALVGGPFAGPFHALYLQAMADTLYGTGATTIRWFPPVVPPPPGALPVRWQD